MTSSLFAISGLGWGGQNDYEERQAWRRSARERARKKQDSGFESMLRNHRRSRRNDYDDNDAWEDDRERKQINWCLTPKLIDNGPRQFVSQDMGFASLRDALQLFFTYCSCWNEGKKFSWSKFDGIINNESESSGSKKRQLYDAYGDAIEYIQKAYYEPIEELEKKYFAEFENNFFDSSRNSIAMLAQYVNMLCKRRCKGICGWHLTMLAHRGSPKAQLLLGMRIMAFLDDFGGDFYFYNRVPLHKKDFYSANSLRKSCLSEDYKWLVLAGENGEYKAYWVLGTFSMRCNLQKEGKNWFQKGADQGEPFCMYELGKLAEKKNKAEALRWFEAASEKHHIPATEKCANAYVLKMQLKETDASRAIKYYERLVELYTQADYNRNKWNILRLKKKIEKLKGDSAYGDQ